MDRLLRKIFWCLLFFLPFELPIVEVSHGLFEEFLGPAYIAISVGFPISLVSLLLILSTSPRPGQGTYLSLGLSFLAIGLLAIIVTPLVCEAYDPIKFTLLSLTSFVFGYLAPVTTLLAIYKLRPDERRESWRIFYAGFAAYLLVSTVPLVYTFRNNASQSLMGESISEQLIRGRGLVAVDGDAYHIFIGNANKTSNYLLIFLLFSVQLLAVPDARGAEAKWSRRILLAFWGLALMTLFVLLSRMAIMFLPLVIWNSGIIRRVSVSVRVACVAVAILIATSVPLEMWSGYLLRSSLPGEQGGEFIGTGRIRLELWSEIYDYLDTNPAAIVHGLGTGGYGNHFFNDHYAGSHNTFLDTLMECGLFGVLLLISVVARPLWMCMDWRRLRWRNRLAGVGAAMLIALMFREHTPAYLFVTSLGGFCFTAIFYSLADHATVTTPSRVVPARHAAAQRISPLATLPAQA